MSNVETLAKAAKDLMLKEPFYGLLLMSLNKIWDERITSNGHGTAGVGLNGINYELRIHPEFWENLPANHKVGVLKHELLHIGFFHLTDYEKFEDKELLNIAMDIEINQYIERDWLPEEGCFLEDFEEIALDKKKGTIYYYNKLLKEKDKNSKIMKAIMDALANGEESCKLPNGNTMELPKHDWKVLNNMDEATKELLRSQTKHIVEQVADQVAKSQGVIPGEFAEILKKLKQIDPPKFDWKGYMRRFAGKSVKTYTKKSRRKYNKRLPDNPGLKIKKQKHILAAIDTSGSVSTSELKEFLNELHHMKKTGSEVTIIQCDTSISHIGKFDPRKDLEIHGRGGTSFQPVIDYYNEKEREYSCLFYFTDGEASTPSNARGNILWVLSSKSTMNDDLPGKVIKLEI
jgi:predicted metal-dependent peptidase